MCRAAGVNQLSPARCYISLLDCFTPKYRINVRWWGVGRERVQRLRAHFDQGTQRVIAPLAFSETFRGSGKRRAGRCLFPRLENSWNDCFSHLPVRALLLLPHPHSHLSSPLCLSSLLLSHTSSPPPENLYCHTRQNKQLHIDIINLLSDLHPSVKRTQQKKNGWYAFHRGCLGSPSWRRSCIRGVLHVREQRLRERG